MNRHVRRALAAVSKKGGKKNTGPWPIGEKALNRIAIIEKDFEQDQAIAQLRANSRISEVFEILRPEGIPDEAVYNPQAKAFVLSMAEESPVDDPATPGLEAAQEEFETEEADATDKDLKPDSEQTE